MSNKPKTKEQIEADIKAILAKDKRYVDAKVSITLKRKVKHEHTHTKAN